MNTEIETPAEKQITPWGLPEIIYAIIGMIVISVGIVLVVELFGFKSNAILIIYELLYLLPVVVVMLIKKAPWEALGLRSFAFSELLVGVSILFLAYIVIFLHNLALVALGIAPQGEYIAELFNLDINIWVLGITVVIAAPIAEEIFFRGFVYAGLVEKFGWKKAVFISALFFGAAHMQLVSFIPTFLMGLVLAYIYQRSKSVILSIILHFTVNGFGFMMIYLVKTFGENIPL